MTPDEKLRRFLTDDKYEELFGIKVLGRYVTQDEQRSCGDLRGLVGNVQYNIEEKANKRHDWNCLLELIQAAEETWETRKMRGWFYDLHKCDLLLHGYFDDTNDESETPLALRIMHWKELRELTIAYLRNGGQLRTRWNTLGYGITLCTYISYRELLPCMFKQWYSDPKYKVVAADKQLDLLDRWENNS